jgi:hypothetical protein
LFFKERLSCPPSSPYQNTCDYFVKLYGGMVISEKSANIPETENSHSIGNWVHFYRKSNEGVSQFRCPLVLSPGFSRTPTEHVISLIKRFFKCVGNLCRFHALTFTNETNHQF